MHFFVTEQWDQEQLSHGKRGSHQSIPISAREQHRYQPDCDGQASWIRENMENTTPFIDVWHVAKGIRSFNIRTKNHDLLI